MSDEPEQYLKDLLKYYDLISGASVELEAAMRTTTQAFINFAEAMNKKYSSQTPTMRE